MMRVITVSDDKRETRIELSPRPDLPPVGKVREGEKAGRKMLGVQFARWSSLGPGGCSAALATAGMINVNRSSARMGEGAIH